MQKLEKNLYFLLGIVAGVALFGMMLLAFIDVAMRKMENPIRGGVELTELLMIVLIFAGLPLVSLRGEHVGFELVDKYLVGRFKNWSIGFMHLVCTGVFAYMSYLMWNYAVRMMADNLETAQLGIARGPFAMVMCILLGVTAVMHVLLMIQGAEKMSMIDLVGEHHD